MKKPIDRLRFIWFLYCLIMTLIIACVWAVVTGYGLGAIFFICAALTVNAADRAGVI